MHGTTERVTGLHAAQQPEMLTQRLLLAAATQLLSCCRRQHALVAERPRGHGLSGLMNRRLTLGCAVRSARAMYGAGVQPSVPQGGIETVFKATI
jgi:hypothetical protein